jgi:uncharacterized protein
MTVGPLTPGHLLVVEPDECRRLLNDAVIGRVGWHSSEGLLSLPVSYGVHHDGRIGFRVGAQGALAELSEPTEVVFEVDDIDNDTLTGWSVLVRGIARSWEGEFPAGLCRAWAPGPRGLTLQIEPKTYSGRSVCAD